MASTSATRTKYGYMLNPKLLWEHKQEVSLSYHALERWDERTPIDSVDPETAWMNGIELDEDAHDLLTSHDGKAPDSIRTYHEQNTEQPYQVVMLERGGKVVTVIDREKYDAPTQAYLSAHIPETGRQGGERR